MKLFSVVSLVLLAVPSWAGHLGCKDLGKGVIDERCNEDYPTCVYKNGGQVVGGNTGDHCALCINSKQPNDIDQVAPDEGCDEEFRVCVGSRQLASHVEGTACAVCFNSISATSDPTDIDDGCPPQAPVCVNDAGQSPAIWTPGTKCVALCTDTSVLGTDKGCSKRFPHCVSEDGSDPGQGKAGTQCSICSPAACDDHDPCTDDFCDPEGNCYHEDNGSCTCPNAFQWTCEAPITFCEEYPPDSNGFVCICDIDTEGNPFCWRNNFCSNVSPCTSSSDCGPNQKCTSTCCGAGHCWDDCALTTEAVAISSLRISAEEATGPTGLGA